MTMMRKPAVQGHLSSSSTRKTVFFFILVLLAYDNLFAQKAVNLETAIGNAGIYIVKNEKIPSKSVVAILNIKSESPKINGDQIINKLLIPIVKDGSLVVTNRNREDLKYVRTEQLYQMSGYVSDETAVRIGHELGARIIITGELIRQGSRYSLRIRITNLETGTLLGIESFPVSDGDLFDYNDYRLYLGTRAGLSLGFYENAYGLYDKSTLQTINGLAGFNASLYTSVSLWRLLAVQAELMFTGNSFEINSGGTWLATVNYNSLIIPVLVKLIWYPSIFSLQGFAGAYLSMPLGKMEVKHKNGSYYADYPVIPGFMAGVGFGIELGPGVILADVRYARDFDYLTASYNGTRDVSLRNSFYFTLGYEIGLLPKKAGGINNEN
ncbi:MAG: PorT family protein [Treponema sp.]|jgi:TolB-like protein|nr:PorT family protein [Treponema sp.]